MRRHRPLALLILLALPAGAAAQECPYGAGTGGAGDPLDPLATLARWSPELPEECTSPLMRSIFDATRPLVAAGKGNTSACAFATWHNDAEPRALLDAREVFPAMARAIASAKSEVDLQTYLWTDGSDGADTLLSALRALQDNRRRDAAPGDPPVQVNIAIDAAPTVRLHLSHSDDGAELARQIDSLGLDPSLVAVRVKSWDHTLLGTLHSKTTVVDGRLAIVTGTNPQTSQSFTRLGWNDAGYVFRGAIAGALRDEFADGWKEPLPPLPDPAGTDGTATQCRPMLVLTREANGNPFSNRTDSTADQGFLALFANARQELHVQTPNFNDDAAEAGVIDAVKRGVTVKLIVSKRFNQLGERIFGGGNDRAIARMWRALADAGVAAPCSKLQVRWYSDDGRTPVVGNGFDASHAKFAQADGQVVIVGSSNMDTQSWNHSREVDVAVDDASLAQGWDAQVFGAAWQRSIPADCGVAQP